MIYEHIKQLTNIIWRLWKFHQVKKHLRDIFFIFWMQINILETTTLKKFALILPVKLWQ